MAQYLQDDPSQPASASTRTLLRPRFAETDQMGVVHHSVYPVWFEAGRVEWMRERGMSYREMEESGLSLAVARLEVHYRASARFDDELAVVTTLRSARSRSLVFDYTVGRLPEEIVVATGTTVHVPTDRSGGAVRMPEPWAARLAALTEVTR